MLKVDHDLHVHSYLSECCHEKATHRPAAIVARAERMGLRTIGFADHVWVNPGLEPSDWYRGQDESRIMRLREDLESISTPVRVLVGCEAETIAPGKFGITREFAESVDFVLLACDHFHMTGFVEGPKSDRPRDIAESLLKFFRSAVASTLATVIPHAFFPCGSDRLFAPVVDSITDAEFLDAFGAAAERNVGIEITTGYLPAKADADGWSQKPWTVETPVRFLRLAKEAGCKFTFASDAHRLEAMESLPELDGFVRALDLTEEDIHPVVRGE